MKTIAVMNQKGGVGKTTTACNLGAALGLRGKRVLVIDLDPQAHLSLHLDHDVHGGKPSIYEVLVEGLPIAEAIVATAAPNVFLLPAHLDLASAELELAGEIGRETVLKGALAGLAEQDRFDLVLIDCPPSLGLLSINGLTAADEVLIPLQAEFFALHGISRLTEVMEKLRRRLQRGPELLGIVLCRMQTTTRLAREVEEEARRHFGGRVFRTSIRQNVRLAEASSHGRTVFAYDPASQGARDYAALAEEILAAWSGAAPAAEPTVAGECATSATAAPRPADPVTRAVEPVVAATTTAAANAASPRTARRAGPPASPRRGA